MVALRGGGGGDDDSLAARLLADIRVVFKRRGEDRIATTTLLQDLRAEDEAPWAEWNKGAGLKAHSLARMLSPFGIRSRTIRLDDATAKGFLLEQFEDAFNRYLPLLPGEKGNTGTTPMDTGFEADSETPHVTDQKPDKTAWANDCAGVTDQNPAQGHGTVPAPGENGYLEHVLEEQAAGRINTAEALERERLHREARGWSE
jgi:hypothetical protein